MNIYPSTRCMTAIVVTSSKVKALIVAPWARHVTVISPGVYRVTR